MERLTAYNSENHKNVAYYPVCFEYPCNGFGCKIDGCKLDYEICQRLAAYEDTGLEPKEIERIVDAYGRGHTLRTESAERLEIIREIKTDRLRELYEAEQDGRLVVLPCKVGDTVYFAAWFGTRPHVVKRVVEPYFYTDDAEDNRSGADFTLKDFGKTVFLTREEAEVALAGKGGAK